jgi:polyisoprenoid-binding protein YceI
MCLKQINTLTIKTTFKMKKTTFILALALVSSTIFAQKKTTTSGTVNFDATTSLDPLPKAENKTVVSAIDTKTGAIAFEAIIKSFSFSNPMMQEHFNSSKWLDSDKFPTSTFKGNITNFSTIDLKKDGTYPADVTGDLTIHGITKPVTTKGSVVVAGKTISANAAFNIQLADYGITGQAIDGGKVAKEPKITVAIELK